MEFHGVDVRTQFKRMRELAPDDLKAFLEFDQKAFKDGAIPAKTKELIALGIAQVTQCPWCIDAHTKKAATGRRGGRRDRRDDLRRDGDGRRRGVEPRRPRAPVPAGAQGLSGGCGESTWHHDLVALARGTGIEAVVERRLGDEGERVRLLLLQRCLHERRRFRGNVPGARRRPARLLDTASRGPRPAPA